MTDHPADHSPSFPTRLSGFSLVELAVVLVILGLLAGGITVGKNMSRSAELRSVTADTVKFRSALSAFREKYNALPGDMPDATTYWGAANGAAATCRTTAGTGTSTCDGNGDGLISPTATATIFEPFRAWQQLSNAGLVEGKYSGIATGGVTTVVATPGTNVPASRIAGTGFTLYYLASAPDANWYAAEYNHVIAYGQSYSSYGTIGGAILPKEALGIDSKSDDGRPGTGTIMGFSSASANAPNCTTTTSAATAVYNSATTNRCALIFRVGY